MDGGNQRAWSHNHVARYLGETVSTLFSSTDSQRLTRKDRRDGPGNAKRMAADIRFKY